MIAIVDYGIGNLGSVENALKYVGGKPIITSSPNVLKNADRIILPGVGAFADGMKFLKDRKLIEPLYNEIITKQKPLLGLCLGMQLLAKNSDEYGLHLGLGWIPAVVRRFKIDESKYKIPHVGWNNVKPKKNSILLKNLGQSPVFYFVHSYHLCEISPTIVIGECNYGINFPAVIEYQNILATQFHPEKSQQDGLKLLKNFINYHPS